MECLCCIFLHGVDNPMQNNTIKKKHAKTLKKSVSELSQETVNHVNKIFDMKEYDYAVNLLETLFSRNVQIDHNKEIYFNPYFQKGIVNNDNIIYICEDWFLFDSKSLLKENYVLQKEIKLTQAIVNDRKNVRSIIT